MTHTHHQLVFSPDTPRRDLPERFTEEHVQSLDAREWYPVTFYAAMWGIAGVGVALRDFDKGIIDPADVRFTGFYTWGRRRKAGEHAGMMIRGAELKRLWRDGRNPGYFARKLAAKIRESAGIPTRGRK